MFWEQAHWFQLFIFFAVGMAWIEFRGMAAGKKSAPSLLLGLPFIAGYLYLSMRGIVSDGEFVDPLASAREALLVAFVMAVSLRHVMLEDEEQGVQRMLVEVVGGIYLAIFGSYLLRLHMLPEGPKWVALVFILAWLYDSGAYFVGKTMGKRSFSRWSPNKTWEGFWGGLVVVAALAPLIVPPLLKLPGLAGWPLALLALTAGALAQLGDLMESMLKRWAGVKDSSTLIGQHGGFLDKMDSSMFVAPLVFGAAVWWGLPLLNAAP